ncbi:hypothetical protein RHCRD62_70126 [Rhodococcus sp. RD6.2]|nr:hypothetical protein RHCRD62_70126 [Rhodococcus sp. RD6.2]
MGQAVWLARWIVEVALIHVEHRMQARYGGPLPSPTALDLALGSHGVPVDVLEWLPNSRTNGMVRPGRHWTGASCRCDSMCLPARRIRSVGSAPAGWSLRGLRSCRVVAPRAPARGD